MQFYHSTLNSQISECIHHMAMIVLCVRQNQRNIVLRAEHNNSIIVLSTRQKAIYFVLRIEQVNV